jgi:hypothetical protein
LAIAVFLVNVALGYVTFKNRERQIPVLDAGEEAPRPGVLEPIDVG